VSGLWGGESLRLSGQGGTRERRTTRQTRSRSRELPCRVVGRTRGIVLISALGLALGVAVASAPFRRAAALVVRAAQIGGWFEAIARADADRVLISPPTTFRSRYGAIPAQVYEPSGRVRRTTLLIPGIHSMGIREPRLTALASELAGSGVRVVTVALPDLTTYMITPRATDVIEDAVSWTMTHTDWAPDGRVGIIGISFAGGLAVVAAGRDSIRDKVAYVVSFGGHGDLPRVMHYLATGDERQVSGLHVVPPHDYGLAVLLYGLASGGIVPANQADGLRNAIATYLLASQLTLVNTAQANAAFAKARDMAAALPPPASTYMKYVNDRDVGKLGPAIAPFLSGLGTDSALSPMRTTSGLPSARIYLLHGAEDSVIPTAESVLLGDYLREKGVDARVLVSTLITHAEVDRSPAAGATWQLVAFWADVLRH